MPVSPPRPGMSTVGALVASAAMPMLASSKTTLPTPMMPSAPMLPPNAHIAAGDVPPAASATPEPATMMATTAEPLPAAVVVGYYYVPIEKAGTARLVALAGWKECQQLCAANVFCDHFAYWPSDSGCMQQSNNVTLVQATCASWAKPIAPACT
mmetsp:Transcript_95226/g.266655  ORF Transcript_95226/g.266655 Transcript_95226/m.266655 type:complete len:154 (-) Transcript_95226:482-943(-)